jgi:aryl-alcohol dehydrogenase-like predicted oxidoreductase
MSSKGIKTVQLGDCGLELCRIGCGTGTVASNKESNQTRLGDARLQDLLRYAFDRGIRFFDAADDYGSHEHVARALKDVPRESWQLVTKFVPVGPQPGPDMLAPELPIKRFLSELQTDTIDLLQIHCVFDVDWPDQHQAQMQAMAELKAHRTIRSHGVSCHSLVSLETAADEPWVDVIHARINPFGVAMDAEPDRVVPVLQRAKANGKGIIGMKLFGQGELDTRQRAESVEWVAGLDCVDVLLPAFESPAEIDEFLAAAGLG